MKVHDRIVQQAHKHKERVTAHIQKHEKKYLFISGAALGRLIFKIILIIGLFLGITFFAIKPHINEEHMRIYQAINSFYQIDDIANQEINETPAEWNTFTEDEKKLFFTLDKEFHNSTDLTGRYKTAKKIIDFLLQHEKVHPYISTGSDVVNPDLERDKRFTELLNIFNGIR